MNVVMCCGCNVERDEKGIYCIDRLNEVVKG